MLYERYQRRISAYVYGMVHDHGRAEDVTQEVFISALRRLRATDARIIFKPWVYEIAKNACIDAFRRSKRAEEVSYDADESALDRSRLVSTSPTPDAAVDQRMTLQNLQGAFGGLSEAHHQILVMRELEGLSYRQIGERLGMSRPSVESTLFRARRRLSEEYEELVSGERCRRVQAIIAQSGEGRLGVRDARKMARHVSHCQPCRRAACLAGVDLGRIAPRPARERLAALLPIPAFLRRRFGVGSDHAAAIGQSAALGQWSSNLATYSDPAMSGWARAAAVAAGVAVAGLGAGVATHDSRLGVAGHDAKAPIVRAAPASATRASARHAGTTAGARRSAGSTRTPRAAAAKGSDTHRSAGASSPSPASVTETAPASSVKQPAAPSTPDTKQAAGSVPLDSSAPSTPTVKATVPAVPSLPSTGDPSTSTAVTAPVGDATQTVTDAAGTATDAAGSTVGGVTQDATNLLGGG